MSAKRKIMIATPIKLGLVSSYMAGFVPTIQAHFPGIELEHCILEGPSVNFARNEIAHYAIARGMRELVFIDDDMGWTLEHFARLISHSELDVVAALYCKRRPGDPFWLMNDKPGCEPDPVTGLCEVNDIATGFMKIRVDTVLKTIAEKHPELEFYNNPEDGKPVTAFEFFPMGVVGPRSPASRLKVVQAAIQKVTQAGVETATREQLLQCFTDMTAALCTPHGPGGLRGEDYMFCHLARECGFKIHADFGAAIIPHIGKVPFPITPEMVGLDRSNAKPTP